MMTHLFFFCALLVGLLSACSGSPRGKEHASPPPPIQEEPQQRPSLPTGQVIELTGYEEIASFLNRDGIVILEFYASWCPTCQGFGPIYSDAARAHRDIRFGAIDVDRHTELAEELEITAVPTLLFIHDRELLDVYEGGMDAEDFEEVLLILKQELHTQAAPPSSTPDLSPGEVTTR